MLDSKSGSGGRRPTRGATVGILGFALHEWPSSALKPLPGAFVLYCAVMVECTSDASSAQPAASSHTARRVVFILRVALPHAADVQYPPASSKPGRLVLNVLTQPGSGRLMATP